MASVLADSCVPQGPLTTGDEEFDSNCSGQSQPLLQIRASEGLKVDHDAVTLIYKEPNNMFTDSHELKTINLDTSRVEMATDRSGSTIFDHPVERVNDAHYVEAVQKDSEEPVTLSKTSSLLREVQELGDDRDMCLPTSIASDEMATKALETEKAQDFENEPITYHVLGNNTILKFEAPRQEGAMEEVASQDTEGFDGHTITLVEDENNAGTFKIAEIGEDNTLRVIDNDRIVVFQDECAMNAVCKGEDNGQAKGKDTEEGPSSCIGQSMNTLHNGHITIPDAYTDPNDSIALFKDNRQAKRRTVTDSCSQRYTNDETHSEEVQGVQTYPDTSIMKPLHAESGAHPGQHHIRNTAAFCVPNSSVPVKQRGPTWQYPQEKDSINTHPHYKSNEDPYQTTGGTMPLSSNQLPFTDYGHTSSSSSATSHGSYSEAGAPHLGYLPHQMTAWPPASGHMTGSPEGNMGGHNAADRSQRGNDGYGHPSATVYGPGPISFMPGASSSYVGYTGSEGARHWPAGKVLDGPESHTSSQDGVMYQRQHTQHHHPSHHGPPTLSRPYPTYPLWEASTAQSTQRHLRYMPHLVRGRNSARVHKTRVNAAVQNIQAPVTISSMASRCSLPVALNSTALGRPRKRSASQMDTSTARKAGFQEGSSAVLTGNKEPARKRGRDQPSVSITNLGTLSSNVHTLKPGHIIAWYIDYLIHENEDRTQISRAFTLPVNLFHTDDFYFLDSLRKKIRFPSPKFLAWMQYHLPSLNAHAIDFREGRPSREGGMASSSLSQWNQDWGWQNKSKRDIIHDVFFHFQHRKAASSEAHQYVCTGSRSNAQLVA